MESPSDEESFQTRLEGSEDQKEEDGTESESNLDSLLTISVGKHGIKPQRAYTSAGLDLFCIEETCIKKSAIEVLPTDIRLIIPFGCYGRIAGRSHLGIRGIYPIAGVLDSEFRGEVKVVLKNDGATDHVFSRGDGICQVILEKIVIPRLVWRQHGVGSEWSSERGNQGFGSSIKKSLQEGPEGVKTTVTPQGSWSSNDPSTKQGRTLTDETLGEDEEASEEEFNG